MKLILMSVLLLSALNSYGQKIKYSEIKPLLESKQDEKALPLLTKYYNQNIVKGAWSNKAILFEMENMSNASENLARIYEHKSNTNKSIVFADSSIYWYNVMVNDDHISKDLAIQKINLIEKTKINWQEEKVANQKRIIQNKTDSINRIKSDSINEIRKLKDDELQKNQIIFKELNSGLNDPMIVAKKYAEAYIKGDMETLIKLGYKDSVYGKIGMFKEKVINSYREDKTRFTAQLWKAEILKYKINTRLSQDFRITDYRKKMCSNDEFDNIDKPLISVRYESETEVSIDKILSYDYKDMGCMLLGNGQYEPGTYVKHMSIKLIKVKGKWLVSHLD